MCNSTRLYVYYFSECMPPRVVSGTYYNTHKGCEECYIVEKLLQFNNTAETRGTYWIGPNNSTAEFILDLCQQEVIKTLRLVNTHNSDSLDRATNEFKVSLSDKPSGPDM